MLKRLRIKFVCINMTIVTVMLLAIFATVLYFTQKNLERESIDMMQSVALNPVQPGVPAATGAGVQLPYFLLGLGPGGELLTTDGGYFDLSDRALLQELVADSRAAGGETGVLQEYGLRYYQLSTPGGQYIVFADTSSERSTMNHLLQNCLLIGAASFVIFLAISLLLARWAVHPVDTAWQQQRQFVADASHELKTPLTVILTNAELLRDAADGAARGQPLADNIITMSHQMRELIERLLDLARVDSGIPREAVAPVDLSRLVSDALLPFEPVYFEKGLHLDTQIEDGVTVQGSRMHLRQAVDILLDNVAKYAAPGADVTVSLHHTDSRNCLLTVHNTGEPIPADELERIFERFYRADKARHTRGGYGLGLSIARGIVHAHRGRIWAEHTAGGNAFCIRLPLYSARRAAREKHV